MPTCNPFDSPLENASLIKYIWTNQEKCTDNNATRLKLKEKRLDELRRLFVDAMARFETAGVAVPELAGKSSWGSFEDLVKFLQICFAKIAQNEPKSACFWEALCLEFNDAPGKLLLINPDQDAAEFCKEHAGRQGKLITVLFFINERGESQYWTSSVSGVVSTQPTGSADEWIFSLWIPQELKISLAECGEHLGYQNEVFWRHLATGLRKHVFSGIMEVHIFIAPINPSQQIQDEFKKHCSSKQGMKCCNLKLDFVEAGLTSVLMSSRYVTGTMDKIWPEAFEDARMLAKLGYPVIRTKIEATASISGVPATDTEARSLPKKTYFEFHMVFQNPQGQTPNDEEVFAAKKIAVEKAKEWGCCIPLSMNCFGTQKFLNMRTYGIGRDNAYPQLEQLGKTLTDRLGYVIPRFIREFGVYDSDVTIDGGWLEPKDPDFNLNVTGFLPNWRAESDSK